MNVYMRFSPEFIERLKNHLPISEVIGRRIPVKRHGREFQGLCPFHKEKSPSFTVNEEKGFFHCFGCGAHGDAIGFIKDFEKITYPEAVERLAGEAGLPLPQMTQEAHAAERKRHTLEDAVALAQRWFTEQLYAPCGREIREYLRERGLKQSTVEKFTLGFAPNARDGLKSALMKQGLTEVMMIEAGLLAVPDEGNAYDRFRARLMFPIRNAQGKTVAFGGRILPQTQAGNAAKYLNSPETPLFKKGELLFAYDMARRAVRDDIPVIVAEGYMDVIALHQAGFETAVAPLGTAVTESQLKLLWRISPEPVICLDDDAAGRRAMGKLFDMALPLLTPDMGLKFVLLSQGEDPDSLIRKAGSLAMREALSKARSFSLALWDTAYTHFGAKTPEQKSRLEQYLMQAAEGIANPIVRQHMRAYFRDRIFSISARKKTGKVGSATATPGVLPAADDDKTHLIRLEEQVIRVVLLYPDILHHAETEEHFGHMDFTQAALDKLRAGILEVSAGMRSLDSASLKTALSSRGYAEKVETLLHSQNAAIATMFHSGLMESQDAAQHAFEQAYSAYTMKKLEHEMHEAALTLERDMTEQSYNRFLALQKQIDELRHTRYAGANDEQIS